MQKLFFLLLAAVATAEGVQKYNKCSLENKMCECEGTVVYAVPNGSGGPSDPNMSAPIVGSVQCTNEVFGGDPAPGQYKQCFCPTEPVAPVPQETPPTDPVVAQGQADMWNENQISTYVTKNFGGRTWNSIHADNLVTEETRNAYATKIVVGMMKEWKDQMEFLPNVCDPGQSCRDKRWVLLQDELKDLWAEMMVSIDSKITIGRTSTKVLINKAYEAAYACKPGCSCENISIEYDQIIKWQENLSTRVIEYTSILSGLITEETTIITSCPAYIYDSDGNAYFDYQAPVVVVAPVVAEADQEQA